MIGLGNRKLTFLLHIYALFMEGKNGIYPKKIYALSEKVKQQAPFIKTEEATKNALILPFISNVLGYDVFDPNEVIPEHICDIGTKKGEKIDFAIVNRGDIQILIECKKVGEELNINNASQLFRYFHVEKARISILTNGRIYKFFTDLDAPNKMDERPFLELDLLSVNDNHIVELKKLTKEYFDIDSIISSAGELKYIGQIKKEISNQILHPEEGLVRFFATKVYDGTLTKKVRDQFSVLVKKSLSQYINDQVSDRLKAALKSSNATTVADEVDVEIKSDEESGEDIVTTQDEVDGFHIVKAIVRKEIDIGRVSSRDTRSYFGVLIDDNNRKPLCRRHFNRAKKYIGLFDQDKKETRYEIESLDDIYRFADELLVTAKGYV
ncbi:type I restriction endonuclease [Asticcacaulis tiandongensis]|uniref:type I restriction endonuclease n=1 Tax=Asticcacaulis tiandongensis TaxID=2565365 RepID=UPI001FE4064C|nr:type I restriction endonuclease [Asticcacaulis tiandongensis]